MTREQRSRVYNGNYFLTVLKRHKISDFQAAQVSLGALRWARQPKSWSFLQIAKPSPAARRRSSESCHSSQTKTSRYQKLYHFITSVVCTVSKHVIFILSIRTRRQDIVIFPPQFEIIVEIYVWQNLWYFRHVFIVHWFPCFDHMFVK